MAGADPVPMIGGGGGTNIFRSKFMKFNTVCRFGHLFINEEHKLACSCPINIFAYIGTLFHHNISNKLPPPPLDGLNGGD